MKYLFFLILLLTACDLSDSSNKKKQNYSSCDLSKRNIQKELLVEAIGFIIKKKPILEKVTEIDPIVIDTIYRKRIDSLVNILCEEVLNDDVFLKFSFVYATNILYSQFKCCLPPAMEIVHPSLMEENGVKNKDAFEASMFKLLKNEGWSKSNIVANGYTHLDMNFPKTYELVKNDSVIVNFTAEVDSLFKTINFSSMN